MEALSSNLLMYIFEFLSLKDYPSLMVTCKDFSNAILNHQKFWVRECLNKHLSFDLELYSEIYDCGDYKSYVRNKILYLQKNAWKQLLEEGQTHNKALASVLNNISPVEDVENFMNDFHQFLKEPNLPMANLKRETIMCTAQTLFQTKLSEVLYEDTANVNKNGFFFDSSFNIIDELKQLDKQIFQEMLLCDKNEIHKARWYNFEHSENSDLDETISYGDKSDMLVELPELPDLTKISNVSTEDLQMSRNRNSILLNLYDNLCASFRHQCKVLHKYLSSLDDIYLLVSEYTARWKVYVCSMLEFEKTFATFTELMNTHYESIFEGYPCFPKFSIWRLMTKIWMREVYEKMNLNRILTESFLKILSNHREANMKEIFNNSFFSTDVEEEELCDLPKSLYVGLRVMEKQKSFHSQYNANLFNSAPPCFKASPEMERDLLAGFLQAVLDLSLNEVKIHYLDCTDFPASYPYCELEQSILCQSNDFYRQYQRLFYESPEYFSHLLKSDTAILSKILVEKSSVKLEIIQQEKGIEVIQEFISQRMNELDEETLRKNEKQGVFANEPEDETTQILEHIVSRVLEEKYCCQFEAMNQPTDEHYMEEELKVKGPSPILNRSFIKAIIMQLEAIPSNFKESLEYIKQRSEYLQTIKQKDECIRHHNIEKNIPCEMGDVDSLFYDLDKTIGISLLEKLYEDYQIYAKQQKKEEGEQEEVQNGNNDNVDNDNFGNGFGMQPDFTQNFDDIDLMSLGELSFRRAMT